MTPTERGIVFDVQRFSIHDGPGIRTVVFLKGCAMNCAWCQNPEAVRPLPELAYYADRCLAGCSECVPACPERALRPDRAARVDWARCTVCGECIDVCPANALVRVGRSVSAPELLAEVLRDRQFFDVSGGGLTLSGGEPLVQPRFLNTFLPLAKGAGLHVALETAGYYPFSALESLLPFVDLVLFDIKVIDSEEHARWTGRDNRLVHDNLRALVARTVALEIRLPVVPGVNTESDHVAATAAFLCQLGVPRLTLLPYNHFWEAKLPRLATDRRPLGITVPDGAYYTALCQAFRREGIDAHG
jgi:pyruvate formate lyase activating enzyme